MRMRYRILIACLASIFPAWAVAENWPQFRGPTASGLPTATNLPTEWGPEKNIAWKVELPGVAWSQPVVWGNRIYVTTAITENQQKPAAGQPERGGRGGPGGERRRGGERGDDRPAEAPPAADAPPPANAGAEQPATSGDAPPRERGPGGAPGGRYGRGGRGAAPPADVYRWMVMCLDESTGKVLWEQLAHEGQPTIPIHRTNTYASETPVTDGEHIYAYFGMTGLYCYDMAGKLVWSKELGSYPMMLGWGTGSSPVLDGDRIIVQCDNEKESFLAAFDKRTGDEQWRVARDEKSNWSTPYLWRNKQRIELVAAGGKKMRAYDPATGKLLWELGGVRGRCSATPVGTDELLYVGVGGGPGGLGPLVAIRAGAEGDITLAKDQTTSAGIAWSISRAGPPMASPLVYQDCLYILEQRGGIVACYNARTGEKHYSERIEGARGFTSSPWAFGDKVFCLDEDGQTFVLAAGPEFELLGTNKLEDTFWSSVAVAGDHLLLRGINSLYSIGPAEKVLP